MVKHIQRMKNGTLELNKILNLKYDKLHVVDIHKEKTQDLTKGTENYNLSL